MSGDSGELVANLAPSKTNGTKEAAFWMIPELAGENYYAVLKRAHSIFKPKTYLEIGVQAGNTLAFADCPSIAIDPHFTLAEVDISNKINNKGMCAFYSMTSDIFFSTYDPSVIFGRKIDMAFLDGRHWYEFLLRDFMNTERFCKKNSIVFMHDCLPTDAHVARRESSQMSLQARSEHPKWWAGDVWKTVAILLKYRPDLQIIGFNAAPTGLVAVTNLNPSSTLLSDRYFSIIGEYANSEIKLTEDTYFRQLRIVETQKYASDSALSSLFWL